MKFRSNVAALITHQGQYLSCCRRDHQSWQTVQGGIENFDLSPKHALVRELAEELGISEKDYKIQFQSKCWRRYHFTKQISKSENIKNAGQDQLWFLVELMDKKVLSSDAHYQDFEKFDWVTLDEFLNRYAIWKKSAVYDFCRELELLPISYCR